jgi:hypothetical protein
VSREDGLNMYSCALKKSLSRDDASLGIRSSSTTDGLNASEVAFFTSLAFCTHLSGTKKVSSTASKETESVRNEAGVSFELTNRDEESIFLSLAKEIIVKHKHPASIFTHDISSHQVIYHHIK